MTDLPSLAETWPLALLLVAIGGVAGVISGLLGVGGGIVLVPALLQTFAALGYDGPKIMQVCLATSLATMIFTSSRALRGHARRGAMDGGLLRAWAPGIAAGAILGVLAADRLPSDALVLIFGVLGLGIGIQIGFGRETGRAGAAMPTGAVRAVAAAAVGFLSVLMGIGGGSFGVPLLRHFGAPIHRAVGTASGFGLVIAVPSVIGFLLTGWGAPERPPGTVGLVNLPALGLVIAASMPATALGVRLAHAMDPRPLRRVFAAFIIMMALNMLRRAIWG